VVPLNGAGRRLPDAAGRQAARRHATRLAVDRPGELRKVMFAGRARRRPQNARRNGRLGHVIAQDQFAVCPDYRLTLKIGQLPVARRPFEIIANRAVFLAYIARSVQRLGADVISGLLVQRSPRVGSRCDRPHQGRNEQYRGRFSDRLRHVREVLQVHREA